MRSARLAMTVIIVWAAVGFSVLAIHGAAVTIFTPTWALVVMTVAAIAGAVLATWILVRAAANQ